MTTAPASTSQAGRSFGVRQVFSWLLLRHSAWERNPLTRTMRVACFGLYVYLGVILMLLALENRFLFVPSTAEECWLPPPPGLHPEDVTLTSADGTQLHAWWCAPPGWTPEQGAMLYSHGNAGNLSGRGEAIHVWMKEIGTAVLIYDYPGYGRSHGKPSEAAIYAAGDAAHDWLTKVQHIPAEKIILYGGSLGGAVAVDLAARRPCRALVLLAAFSSFPDMAQKTFPWLPARWLVRNQLDNASKIGKVHAPVFIAHGTADTLIPFSQGQKLFAAATEPRTFVPLEGHGHNDLPGGKFYTALRPFLEAHPLQETPSAAK